MVGSEFDCFIHLLRILPDRRSDHGKMALGIEVVTDSPHEKIGLIKSFLRTILLVVDLMPYILPGLGALIVMAISDKNQRIGDMAAKTVVIKK